MSPARPLPADPLAPAYRPDIDGLRAVAIATVVAFHAFPAVMPGGFVGVDVFFVISGYLIGSIVLAGLRAGRFDFVDFYARRARRIFPALLLVLAASLAVGWFTLLPEGLKSLGKHAAGSAGFVQNFILYFEAGYFDAASEKKPLLHLWSLSVEEQFYLALPLLAWGAWRFGGARALAVVLAITAAASFGLAVALALDGAHGFYLPHARAWELLVGVGLALARHDGGAIAGPAAPQRALLAAGGLALIGVSLFVIDGAKSLPGAWAGLPVAGAALLIAAGPSAPINRHLLARPGWVLLGKISYPLYLWHWPALSFARLVESGEPSVPVRLAALFASLVLAWLTWRWVETPLRNGRLRPRALVLTLALAATGIAGYAIHRAEGLPSRALPQSRIDVLSHLAGMPWEHPECALHYRVRPCLTNGANPDVLVIGDSHAHHLFPGLAALGGRVILHTGTCAALDGIFLDVEKNRDKHPCGSVDFLAKNFAILGEVRNIRTVVIAGYWEPVLQGRVLSRREHDTWGEMHLRSRYPEEQGLSRQDLVFNGLVRTLHRLQALGVRVVLVRDAIGLERNIVDTCGIESPAMAEDCTLPRPAAEAARSAEAALFARIRARFPGLAIVDPLESLCTAEHCYLMRARVPYFRDEHHFSYAGSQLVARQIAPHLAP